MPAGEQRTLSLSLEETELYPTWNAVGVEIPFAGDYEDNPAASLFWRKNGEKKWRNGVDFTPDPELGLLWASIYPLEPGETITVRISLSGLQAPDVPAFEKQVSTRSLLVPCKDGGRSLYVSPTLGENSNPGTKARPFKTLSHAVSAAVPGDVVYALDGIYCEGNISQGLTGSEGRPLAVLAAPGHKPVLDSSHEIPKGCGLWKRHSGDVYCTPIRPGLISQPEAGLGYASQDGVRLFLYDKLKDLLNNKLNVPRSWHYDRKRGTLYVRTGAAASPENYRYNLARHAFAFHLEGSEYVILQGFDMRCYGQAAIRLSDGTHDCLIADNIILNAPWGISLIHKTTHQNAIWRNTVRELGITDVPFRSIKDSGYPRQGINSVATGRGNSYNFNLVDGWFDGICTESYEGPDRIEIHRDTDVMYNKIINIGTDAFELDGGGVNMRLHGNTARNSLVAISLAPVIRGPVYVTRNEVTFLNLMFKFNVGGKWSSGYTYVYHNSGYGLNAANGMGLIGLTGIGAGGPDTRNKFFRNNAMIGADFAVREGYDGNNSLDYDLYYHIQDSAPRRFQWNRKIYSSMEGFREATGQETHGLYADPLFADTPGLGRTPWNGFLKDVLGNHPLAENAESGDMRLLPTSPCIDRGTVIRGVNEDFEGRAPDIGAFEYGK